MFKPLEKFADINPITANGIATADLPVAGVYHAIYLRCIAPDGSAVSVANMKADIERIRLTLDGVNYFEPNSDAIFDLFTYYYNKRGASVQAGIFPILLTPSYFENDVEAAPFGYGMADINTLQLEIEFGSAVNTAAHIAQVQVFVERTNQNRPLGTHRRLIRLERAFSSSGVQEVTDISFARGEGTVTTAMHIQHDGSAAVINNVEVLVNNQVVVNAKPNVMQVMSELAGRKWMADTNTKSLFSIPFNLSNNGRGYLTHVGIEDLRLKIDWSAAPGSYTILHESIHNVGKPN